MKEYFSEGLKEIPTPKKRSKKAKRANSEGVVKRRGLKKRIFRNIDFSGKKVSNLKRKNKERSKSQSRLSIVLKNPESECLIFYVPF